MESLIKFHGSSHHQADEDTGSVGKALPWDDDRGDHKRSSPTLIKGYVRATKKKTPVRV